MVLLFSDNGGVASLGSVNLPYRGVKGEYWEGGVRVPALVAGGYTVNSLESGELGAAYKYKHMVHIMDLHSTVLALAGVDDGLTSSSFVSPRESAAAKNTGQDVGGGLAGGGGAARAASRADIRNTATTTVAADAGVPAVDLAADTSSSTDSSSTISSSSASDDLDGMDMWDAFVDTGDAVRHTVIINVNSLVFANSGSVRHGRYKLIRNPDPEENKIYSKVRTALVNYGFFVSEVR